MPAEARGIRAGRAFVELFADDSRLVRGLQDASQKVQKWGESVSSIGKKIFMAGAAATTAMTGAAMAFASAGDKLQKMSLRTGFSVEALSELAHAAETSGTSLDDIETATRAMQRNISADSKEMQDAFAEIGIAIAALRNLSPEDQFTEIADALSKVADPTQKAALAMKIFGETGTELLPLFEDGATGLAALRKEARDLGLTMTTEDANAAATFGDAVGRVTESVKRAVVAIGSALAPLLTGLADKLTALITPIIAIITNNRGLIVSALQAAAAVTAVGIAIYAAGKTMAIIGAAIGGVATAISLLGSLLGAVIAAVTALLTPTGLIVAAVAGLAAGAVYATGAWQGAIEYLGEAFSWLAKIATTAWQGIADAIAAGDLALAGQIAMAALKQVWFAAIAELKTTWYSLTEGIQTAWTNVQYDLAGVMLTAVNAITNIWFGLQEILRTAWAKTMQALGDGWDSVYFWLKRGFTNLIMLFDTAEEKAAAMGAIDREQAERRLDRQKKTDAALADIEKDRQKREADYRDQMNTLEEDRGRALKDIGKGHKEDIDAIKAQADAAGKQLDDLAKKAKEEREKQGTPTAPEPAPTPKAPLGDIEDIIEKAAAAPQAAERRLSVAGTFNALAAMGMGTGGPMDRTARATEQSAKYLKKLLEQTKDAGVVFA